MEFRGYIERHAGVVLTTIAGLYIAIRMVSLSATTLLVLFVTVVICGVLMKYPEAALVMYVTSLGFLDPVAEVFGLPEGIRALPFAIMVAFLVLYYFLKRKRALYIGGIGTVAILILLLLVLGLLWTDGPLYGRHKVAAYLMYNMLAFLGTTAFVEDGKRLKRMMYTGLWLGLLVLAIGVAMMVSNFTQGEWERYSILGFTPLPLARSLGVLVISCLVVARICPSGWQRRILLAAIPVAVFFLFQTGSRMPTVSALLSLLIYLVFLSRRSVFQKLALVGIAGIMSYGIFLYAPEGAQQRFTGLLEGTDQELDATRRGGRAYLYHEGMEAFKTQPIIGLGTGGFTPYYAGHDTKGYPHNLMLEMAAELGGLGVGVMGVFLALNGVLIWRIIRNNREITKDNSLLIWGALLFLLAVGNSMTTGDITDNSMIWFASAFMWTAYKSGSRGGENWADEGKLPVRRGSGSFN